MAWLAILMGFFFLLRSSEYLRKGAEVDDQKCLRMRNLIWACNDCRDDAEPGIDCDELILSHEFSKNDFMGQGTGNNIKRCKDVRLCIPSLIDKPRVMKPSAFEEKNRGQFVFTMSDGKEGAPEGGGRAASAGGGAEDGGGSTHPRLAEPPSWRSPPCLTQSTRTMRFSDKVAGSLHVGKSTPGPVATANGIRT